VRTRRVDQGPCLNCGRTLTAASARHDHAPAKGAIMVCAYCSHVMEWTGERLTELSDEALEAIAGDPELVGLVNVTGLFQRWLAKKGRVRP